MSHIAKTIVATLFASALCTTPLAAESLPKHLFAKTDGKRMQAWVDSVYQSLSQEERLAQLIMPIIYPSSDEGRIAQEEARIRKHKWGGILYQKGMLADQVRMNRRLQGQSKTPMLIALDGEWGLFMRLKDAPRYPRNLGLGLNEEDEMLYAYGREVARQCRLVGIHVNFAPTVDVNINPLNPVIGSRSFGHDPVSVSKMSKAYAMGLEDGGVLSVAKHFPGHGDTSEDSHKTLPLVAADRKRLDKVELAPFRAYITSGFGGIMTAHLKVPALDASPVPSSLSRKITTDLLQRELGFSGLIFTDGLEMRGVHAGAKGDVGVAALKAGNDILLGPSHAESQLSALLSAYSRGELDAAEIKRKVLKVLSYKYRLIVAEPDASVTPERIKTSVWTPEASRFASLLWQRSLHYYHKDKAVEASLAAGKYKRIAVVQIGSNPVGGITRPRNTSYGATIDYHNWEGFERKASGYDYILVNAFSNSVPSEALVRIASQRPLGLVYYSTPFKVRKAAFMSRLSSVALAMEAAREAQEAVLSLLSQSTMNVAIPSTPSRSSEDQDDPTAQMTPEPKQQVSFLPRGMRQIDPKRLEQRVSELVREAMGQGAFPGCQVYVMQHGREVLNKAYGTLEGAPSRMVSTKTIYDVASVSKALATTPAVMLLVADGKLKLGERVSKYLPELAGSFAGSVSLRNLLLHQSGLAPGMGFAQRLLSPELDNDGRAYYKRAETDSLYSASFSRSMALRPQFDSVALSMIAGLSARRPGQYVYSDINFILLGKIVERVAGEPLDSFLSRRLFAPLGAKVYYNPLKHGITLDKVAPSQRYEDLRGEKIWGTVDDESAATLGGVAGNAGLFASAEELAKLAQLVLNKGKWQGKHLLSESVVEQFLSARGVGGVRTLGFIRPQWGQRANQAAESASSEAVGHYGFTGSAVWIDPKDELVFVFLSNRTYTGRNNSVLSRERYRPRLHQAIYDSMR